MIISFKGVKNEFVFCPGKKGLVLAKPFALKTKMKSENMLSTAEAGSEKREQRYKQSRSRHALDKTVYKTVAVIYGSFCQCNEFFHFCVLLKAFLYRFYGFIISVSVSHKQYSESLFQKNIAANFFTAIFLL